jgi:class 3 adenylate cyclase
VRVPDIHYARSADGTHIAYQVAGEGPTDLLIVAPAYSNIELVWTIPSFAPFLTSLASIGRVICFDPRGAGMSDPLTVDRLPTLEARVADALTVLEAARSDRPVLFGMDSTGPLAIFFAATNPDRTTALILFGTYACGLRDEDYPWAWAVEDWENHDDELEEGWGQPEFVESFVRWMEPTTRLDPESLSRWTSYYRQAASPGTAKALNRLEREIDVRPVLRTVQAPTLVLHRKDEAVYHVEEGRYMARHIPGARFVELEGADHLPGDGDMAAVLTEINRFLGSVRDEEASFDRMLASVLFTDIVGSTEKAADLGDRRWRALIEDHHATVRAILARYHGVEIDTAGDGFFATFDGPARAVRCAQAIVDAVRALELEVRAGVHTGEVETIDGKVGGVAVNIGARVGAMAGPSEVLVSSTVKDLVAGSGLEFEDRGERDLKGLPDPWHLYRALA